MYHTRNKYKIVFFRRGGPKPRENPPGASAVSAGDDDWEEAPASQPPSRPNFRDNRENNRDNNR